MQNSLLPTTEKLLSKEEWLYVIFQPVKAPS